MRNSKYPGGYITAGIGNIIEVITCVVCTYIPPTTILLKHPSNSISNIGEDIPTVNILLIPSFSFIERGSLAREPEADG